MVSLNESTSIDDSMVETSEQFHNPAEEEDIVDEKEMVNKFCNEWVESLD